MEAVAELNPDQKTVVKNVITCIEKEEVKKVVLTGQQGIGKTAVYGKYIFEHGLKRFPQVVITTSSYPNVKEVVKQLRKFFPEEMKKLIIVLPMGREHCSKAGCGHSKEDAWKLFNTDSFCGEVIDIDYVRNHFPEYCQYTTLKELCQYAHIVITHSAVLEHSRLPLAQGGLLIADEFDEAIKSQVFTLIRYNGSLGAHLELNREYFTPLIKCFRIIGENAKKLAKTSTSKKGKKYVAEGDYDEWKMYCYEVCSMLTSMRHLFTGIPRAERDSVMKHLKNKPLNKITNEELEREVGYGIITAPLEIKFYADAFRFKGFYKDLKDKVSFFKDESRIFYYLPSDVRKLCLSFIRIGANLNRIQEIQRPKSIETGRPYLEYHMISNFGEKFSVFDKTIYVSATPPTNLEIGEEEGSTARVSLEGITYQDRRLFILVEGSRHMKRKIAEHLAQNHNIMGVTTSVWRAKKANSEMGGSYIYDFHSIKNLQKDLQMRKGILCWNFYGSKYSKGTNDLTGFDGVWVKEWISRDPANEPCEEDWMKSMFNSLDQIVARVIRVDNDGKTFRRKFCIIEEPTAFEMMKIKYDKAKFKTVASVSECVSLIENFAEPLPIEEKYVIKKVVKPIIKKKKNPQGKQYEYCYLPDIAVPTEWKDKELVSIIKPKDDYDHD